MAKEKTLNALGEMIERGFKAVADDIADIRKELATKEDVRAIVAEELTAIHAELKSIRGQLDDLAEKFENVSGFRKEIDHALEPVAAIDGHLKIKKKIAA